MAKIHFIKALSAAGLLAASSVSLAQVVPYADDFEGYGTAGVPGPTDFAPWFGFSDNGGFPGGYTFTPSTSGPQISALGYNGSDNQYWVTYANYDNQNVHDRVGCGALPAGCSPNVQEQISMFIQQSFTGADTAAADTWVFKFNYAESDTAPPAGSTEVGGFVRVFDPIFNVLYEQTLDTRADATTAFQPGRISVTMDPVWLNGFVQFGFYNHAQEYENSGMFYDDVEWVKADPAVIDIRSFGSTLHPEHDGRFLNIAALPDDEIRVLLFGQSTGAGDPFDFNADNIEIDTVRFGPGQGAVDPSALQETGFDQDSDGQNDARLRFLMSDSGIQCDDTDAVITGDLSTGETFAAVDAFTADCDVQCHN